MQVCRDPPFLPRASGVHLLSKSLGFVSGVAGVDQVLETQLFHAMASTAHLLIHQVPTADAGRE